MKNLKKRTGTATKRSAGGQPANRNALKFGLYTAEAKAELRRIKELAKLSNSFLSALANQK